jgi:transposase InsO family protein
MDARDIPLPDRWQDIVRKAMLHVVSLARWDMICIHSEAEDSELPNVRAAAKIDQRDQEISLLREQIRILAARGDKIPPKNRPYYSRHERMAILQLKAARCWNRKQASQAFGISADTISYWMKQLDETEETSIVQIPVPVNKYPDFVQHVCQQLKIICPRLGKDSIAEYFARSGLHLSATTVGRVLKRETPTPSTSDPIEPHAPKDQAERIVTAKHPNHVWHVDLTIIPTAGGFWTAWLPNALPQRWPFCWWAFLIVDHFSRKCIGFAIFSHVPSSAHILEVLNRAIAQDAKPKHIISDKGSQFWPSKCKSIRDAADHPFLKWCNTKGIKPRFGAVGQHGSIAVIERFIRTLKSEGTRQFLVPLRLEDIRHELACFVCWYNEHRPHKYLAARTPNEVYSQSPPLPRIEETPNRELPKMTVAISYFEGRKHLPIIKIRAAA